MVEKFIRYIKISTDLKFIFIFEFLSFKSSFLGYFKDKFTFYT